ncbi:MAG: GNAT family N-acetyltransferase [Thermoanaerobaculia bacterium]
MSRVVLRELRSPSEFAAAQAVAQAAWGTPDLSTPAAADLIAITHSGGLTAAAFEGKEVLGFVHGFPRVLDGKICQHSHLLAVHPKAQGRGLSVRLKFFQRSWCLARGIRLVTWTYDPLLVKNARLNLGRLRARAKNYFRDFYGHIGGMYGSLPTDRFEIHWDLLRPEVKLAAQGRLFAAPDPAGIPLWKCGVPPRARSLGVEIPLGAPGIYSSDAGLARRARLRLRRMAETLMRRGYAATGIAVAGKNAVYVFER